jgi:hypothetical protein
VWKPLEHPPTLWKTGKNLSQSLHSSLIFEAHHTTKKAKPKPMYGGGMAELLSSPPALAVLFLAETKE